MAKNYEDLVFTDDFMFGKVMEDRELCRELLECLLEHPVGELQEIQTEKQFRYMYGEKPIRLDVYTRDRDSVYDAEMQNLNHKTLEQLELPLRSRSYQSLIDSDMLCKGTNYRDLPEVNVIFICTFDPFGEDLPRYTFLSRCEENPAIALGDRLVKVFYNCTCLSDEVSDEIQALFRYIRTGAESSELTRHIDAAVKRARQNEKWRSDYMKERFIFDDLKREGYAEGHEEGLEEGLEQGREEGLEQGREEGLEQGREEARRETYARCIEAGLSEEQARDLSGWKGDLVSNS